MANRTKQSNDLSLSADKVSALIRNWRIKLTGGANGLSVDAFIYRMEVLTTQTLHGCFSLDCQHAKALFESKDNEW